MSDGPEPMFPLFTKGPEGGPSSYPQIGATDGPPPQKLFQASGQPPARAGTSIDKRVWAVAAAIVTVIAVIGLILMFTGSSNDEAADSSNTAATKNSTASSHNTAGAPTSVGTQPSRARALPPLVRTPDAYGQTCETGFQLPGRSGWGSRSGRGTPETSCAFTNSVLEAYWHQYSQPSTDSRVVVANGTVPCPSTGGECSGDAFLMRCSTFGSDDWITCTGGKNARVYIY